MSRARPRHPGAGTVGCLAAWALLAPAAAPSVAQTVRVSGYALTVGARAGAGSLGPGGASLLGRARVMPVITWGPLAVDVAYEHILSRAPAGGGVTVTTPGGKGAAAGDWLGADWTLRSTSRSSWRHRMDRASAGVDAGAVSVVVGRQAVSWATTLLLTPADPFAPFDPSDPFREYRGGVDAIRVRAFPGPFSEVEAVARAARTPEGATLTALARGQRSLGGWAVGAWGGILHEGGAGAIFASGAAGAAAVRAEVAVREGPDGRARLRGALGGDRRFSAAGRDLYVIAELQYDGFGASAAADLVTVTASGPFLRGEMQTLGRWTAATRASYQAHPLVAVDAMALGNLLDGSVLVAPGVSWSASAAGAVRLGAFVGAGADRGAPGAAPASEYGPVPWLGYVAVSWFF